MAAALGSEERVEVGLASTLQSLAVIAVETGVQ